MLQRLHIIGHVSEVAVADEKCNDVERVLADPVGDICKVGLGGAGIQKIARGVAVVDRIVEEMGLSLQHTNPIIQLGNDAVYLVRTSIIGVYKGRVVCCYVGHITIISGAEFRVIVARLGVGRLSG